MGLKLDSTGRAVPDARRRPRDPVGALIRLVVRVTTPGRSQPRFESSRQAK